MEGGMSSNHPEQPLISPDLVRAWRADAEHDPDQQKAYLRFLQKRPLRARVHLPQVAGWLFAGMLLGMGSLYAATSVPWRLLLTSANTTEARHTERPAPPARNAAASTASPPSSPPPLPSTEQPPARAAATSAEHVEPAPSSATPESWQRAARALRERDFETANDALARLSQQGSQAEREAASLVRAQFLLNEQRSEEAQALLLELSRTSGSAQIRDKANKLLGTIQKSPASHRSFESGVGTNHP
jgi:hypothetical protein